MAHANHSLIVAAGGAPGDPLYADRVKMDLDNSYPAGGYPMVEGTDADRTALNAVIGSGKTIIGVLQQEQQQEGTAGIFVGWDYTNTKLQVFDAATGLELGGGTDLANIVNLELIFLSK